MDIIFFPWVPRSQCIIICMGEKSFASYCMMENHEVIELGIMLICRSDWENHTHLSSCVKDTEGMEAPLPFPLIQPLMCSWFQTCQESSGWVCFVALWVQAILLPKEMMRDRHGHSLHSQNDAPLRELLWARSESPWGSRETLIHSCKEWISSTWLVGRSSSMARGCRKRQDDWSIVRIFKQRYRIHITLIDHWFQADNKKTGH